MPPTKEATRERLVAFAVGYADVTSPTYGNGKRSVQAVAPEYTEDSCSSVAARWLKHPIVMDKIDEIRQSSRAMAALTPGEYVRRALEMTDKLIKREGRGDATAAGKFFELAGKAAGLLIQKTEDMTPIDRKFPPAAIAREELRRLLNQMDELNKPNALPPGQVAVILEDKDVHIEEDPYVREVEPDAQPELPTEPAVGLSGAVAAEGVSSGEGGSITE